ncbi:MAG: terpene synthase family protein [Algoriphagus sp.]|uniref:terpene synthase family protein n=1 Tax=Algoriphagus sp. TaxID=1872435 RepID=UPI002604A504|nr:terpene synthase family protein [Algoriphagus sp.]MDG1277546.1 terpene synthase family protein [Algoriphagus sp.]
MKTNSFPIAISIYCPQLETEVLDWLRFHLPSWNKAIFKGIFAHRINWFAAYLLPEFSRENLQSCMRLFLCLFLLDDLLDRISPLESKKCLTLLRQKETNSIGFNQEILEFKTLIKKQIKGFQESSPDNWFSEWNKIWDAYLGGLEWEITNKMAKQKPDLEDYWQNRIHSLGVFLALHILKLEFEQEPSQAIKLEQKAAKLICISNDIISLSKERALGDFSNGILLSEFYLEIPENQAIELHKKQIEILTNEIWELSSFSKGWTHNSDSWLRSFLLLIGGCLYWSEQDTLRYSTAINGQIKN